MRSQTTTQYYTPHATLAAIGIKINRLQLFDTISKYLYIKQKTVLLLFYFALIGGVSRLAPSLLK